MNILGIIPAREGSKRVINKNFRPFAGSSLVEIAINQALKSKLLTNIVISSDSEVVLNIGANYPSIVCLKRPIELANDLSPAIDYVKHVLEVLEPKLGKQFDIIAVLQPSSPLRNASDIDATIQLLIDNKDRESAVSVVKVDHMIHPVKIKKLVNDLLLPFFEEENGRFASQDLEDLYVRNCAVYAIRKQSLLSRNSVISPDSLGYVMLPDTSVDINEMLDFEFAEFLYNKQLNK
jgi:CMP-N,N'-diacetyllegionaminic acid synthase